MSLHRNFQGIQARLFLILLAVFLPILIIQGYIYHDRYETRRKEELQANLELARSLGRTFEAFVKDILRHELVIARAATSPHPPSPEDFKRYLEESAGNYPAIRNYTWGGPEGRVIASSMVPPGTDFTDRPFFRAILSGRDWFVSDLVFSPVDGELVFTISRGVWDQKGNLLGIVIAAVLPDQLDSVLSIKREEDAAVSLVDSKGFNVYRHPARAHTWEQRNWLKQQPLLEHALEGKDVVTTVVAGKSGRKRLVGYAPVPSIGWVAAASREEAVVMEPITLELLYHSSLFLIVALIAFGGALVFARRITGSIRRLSDHALALGRGEERNPEFIGGDADTEALAHALNEMARKVQSREKALKDSEERFLSFMDNTPYTAWIKDAAGRYVYVNKNVERHYGVRVEEWLGKTDFEVFSPEAAMQFRKNDQVVLENSQVEQFTDEDQGPDGGRSIWWKFKFPFQDASGQKYVGGVGVNITALIRAEEALRESEERYKSLHAELDHRVKERTLELERKNRDLQEFAFVATHDLSEPLRKIQAFGSLLEERGEGRLSEQERDYISRMREAAGRMREFLDDLLRYSHIDTIGQELKPIRLEEVVKTAVADLEPQIREFEARAEIGPLPAVTGDPHQLRQLFQNLLSNAVKYHRPKVKPVIKIHGEEKGGNCIVFVEDNGIGFDEKYLDKIFQPFQRLHGRKEYPGTGMGLAICRKIVERHNGAISAKSTPGGGSTFIVTLPAEKKRAVGA